jgi:putative endonuclease
VSADWQVYLLRCADGTLYTGIARDVQRRLRQHNGELAGGARYTSGRRPVELLWVETCNNRSAAQKREAEIRRLPRAAKLALTAADRFRCDLSPVADGKGCSD